VSSGEITADRAAAAAAGIGDPIDDLAPMGTLAARSLEIAQRLRHPVYDCFYLALAERAGTRMVTADRALVKRTHRTPWGTLIRALTYRRSPG
jgi:predicted nucleic acid-binding protein